MCLDHLVENVSGSRTDGRLRSTQNGTAPIINQNTVFPTRIYFEALESNFDQVSFLISARSRSANCIFSAPVSCLKH